MSYPLQVLSLYKKFIKLSRNWETTVPLQSFIEKNDSLKEVRENDKQLTSGTTGLSSWQAASILASYILYDVEFNLKHNFRDKKILEIGSGCGLTGIAIKIFNNPSFINLTDGNEIVLKQLEYNVQVNDLSFESDNIAVSYLNWEEEYRDDIIYDYIIAADVVYDPSILSSLLKTISKLLQSNTSAVFIIASTLRNPETIEAFENQIGKEE
uniref:Methyltransferase-domain-containing protein n=1 Tax=Parastrongyloides trichosuri TaxID=131310 RepID=A0A0N5A2G4_PARTI